MMSLKKRLLLRHKITAAVIGRPLVKRVHRTLDELLKTYTALSTSDKKLIEDGVARILDAAVQEQQMKKPVLYTVKKVMNTLKKIADKQKTTVKAKPVNPDKDIPANSSFKFKVIVTHKGTSGGPSASLGTFTMVNDTGLKQRPGAILRTKEKDVQKLISQALRKKQSVVKKFMSNPQNKPVAERLRELILTILKHNATE